MSVASVIGELDTLKTPDEYAEVLQYLSDVFNASADRLADNVINSRLKKHARKCADFLQIASEECAKLGI